VILNLAINARDAMPSGGTLTIETANVPSGEQESELPPGDFIRITVRDTGSGMSEEVLAKVFEPFFTTKDIGKGTGLGLPQVHGVVKQSGGDVRMRSRLGEGTTVDVYLPRTHGIPRSAGTEMARPALSRSRATILLVDDDPDVRDFVATALAQLGYDVQVANGARAALDLMDARDRCATVDLLLADFAMPELTGAELARAARARRPDLPIVFISGYSEQNLSGQLDGADGLVKKPFKLVELARVIERALERRRPGHSSTSGNVVPLRGSRDA
jgi:CheY-like chemotaxis protein